MISHTTARFRRCLRNLPADVRRRARRAYATFRRNPLHPGLRFKRLGTVRPIRSVRISADHRALGVRDGDIVVWFWIRSHADYDRMISEL